jgi:hypothetical protein
LKAERIATPDKPGGSYRGSLGHADGFEGQNSIQRAGNAIRHLIHGPSLAQDMARVTA